ncbi:MAG: universal stress protein [Bacteroidetes bacterium]|nr:universal stress protein [Bacteroidota bacterium]MBS1943469.1 universal stress protein [Bacteroidota bacterium]
MKHILLPSDFSDASFNAAKFALGLYGTKDAEYTFLNVYLKLAYRNALLPPGQDTERASRNGLRRMERRFRKEAGTVHLALRSSFSALANAMEEADDAKPVDLVVMGTQGEGNYGLVGRNTSAAVTSATLPVIAVPARWQPVKLDRILFADDGVEDTAYSLEPLLDIVRRTGAALTVLHVDQGADTTGQRAKLKALLKNVPHTVKSVAGAEVVPALERLVAEEGADLVAVVRRQRSFWHRLFNGSTSKRMALHTNVPLLVLRG